MEQNPQTTNSQPMIVFAGILLFGLSVFLLTTKMIMLPAVLILSLCVIVFFFQYPRTGFGIIIAGRIIIDIFGWVPIQIGPLNLFAIFTGFATAFIILLFFYRFKNDLEHHPCIHLFLWFTVIILFGAIRAINTKVMFDEFFRLFSPPLLLFVGTSILYKKNDSRKLIYLIILAGVLPILVSGYHLLSGQMDTYYLNGKHRLLGGYQNLRHHSLMMLIFSCCGVFWLFQAKKPWHRMAALSYTLLATLFMYLTYTRASLLVFVVFLLSFFYFTRRKRLFYFVLSCGVIFFFLNSELQERYKDFVLLFTLNQETNVNAKAIASLGSGRYGLWTRSLEGYMESSIPELLLGSGCGSHWLFTRRAYSGFISVQGGFVDTHNDLLRILYQVGPIALILFVLMAIYSAVHGAKIAKYAPSQSLRDIGGLIVALSIAMLINNTLSNGINSRLTVGWCYWVICSAGFALTRELRKEHKLKQQEKKQQKPQNILRLYPN